VLLEAAPAAQIIVMGVAVITRAPASFLAPRPMTLGAVEPSGAQIRQTRRILRGGPDPLVALGDLHLSFAYFLYHEPLSSILQLIL
jgi:hypothetical protein